MAKVARSLDLKRLVYLLLVPIAALLLLLIAFAPSIIGGKNYRKIETDRMVTNRVLQAQSADVLLLFFGYVGCTDVCTPRLNDIARIYRKLEGKANVKVLFISLVPTIDKTQPDWFAKYFDDAFEGVYLEGEELEAIKRQFEIYIAEALGRSGAYDHTAHLYLLQRRDQNYVLRYIYTHTPLDEAMIVEDIRAL